MQPLNFRYKDNFTCPICAVTLQLFNSFRKHLVRKHRNFIDFLQSKDEFENQPTTTLVGQVIKKIKSNKFDDLHIKEFKDNLGLSKKIFKSQYFAKSG